jgi:uncharacterized RDD family membrane protein YckC
MQWYYAKNNEQLGPFTDEAFAGFVQSGEVTAETLVWNETMADWAPYRTVAAPAPPADGAPPVVPAAAPGAGVPGEALPAGRARCDLCGGDFADDEVILYEGSTICAGCKPRFMQQLREGVALPGARDYGGFWIRFVAKFLDGIILGVVNMVISFVGMGLLVALAQVDESDVAFLFIQLALYAVQLAVGVAYTTFFLGKFAATPGKMACRLKVIRSDGSPLTYGRACGRHFADWLSSLTLYIGYIIAAFDDEKRTLHDRICDTRVIKVS